MIIDEYLELFHHHQEWIELVIHIGQEGRGCNVFFTLGGQRLDLSSLSKAKSNIAFRVALRAETAEDSRDVIGSDAALHLPSKENGYALLKVGPRDLEPFRCFYVSAPFVLPKKAVNVSKTVDVSFSQPRPLTWEYQPLSDEDNAALAVAEAPEEPDEFLFHADGFRKKKLLDVIRESLISHPARLPHQIWLPPLEVSEQVDALVRVLARQALARRLRAEPGAGVPDRDRGHSRRTTPSGCTSSTPRWTTSWWSGTAQRGKSTTLMTLMTSAALMYRPERVTFFCIGAALYPVEELPHVAGVVSLNDTEGRVTDHRHDRGIDPRPRGVVQAVPDRHLRVPGAAVRRGRRRRNRSRTTSSATSSSSSTTSATCTRRTPRSGTGRSPSPARDCPTACT